VLHELLVHAAYLEGSFDDHRLYETLAPALARRDEEAGQPLARCFYLATALQFFGVIVRELGEHGLDRHDDAAVRIVVEKPFGSNLRKARELNRTIHAVFSESQVFRPRSARGDRPRGSGRREAQRHGHAGRVDGREDRPTVTGEGGAHDGRRSAMPTTIESRAPWLRDLNRFFTREGGVAAWWVPPHRRS
jgi:hypothetical protein